MPISNYPGIKIDQSTSFPNPKKISLPNVIQSFDDIPLNGDFIPIKSDQVLINSKTYNPYKSSDIISFKKEPNRKRHFQGMVRTSDGNHIILSGGDHKAKVSQLFICRVPVQHSNEKHSFGIKPMIGFKYHGQLKEIFVINDKRFWHNGGITIFGDVLVVPLESNGFLPKQKYKTRESLVKFIDVSNPLKPKDLGIDISRIGTNSGTASLIKLSTGYFLCCVWTDSDPGKGRTLDFYISKTKQLKDGFNNGFKRFVHSIKFPGVNPKYQTVQMFLQSDDRLFLTGNENTNTLSPIPPAYGKNRARLYEIKFGVNAITINNFSTCFPDLSIIRGTNHKIYKGGRKRYNFSGASGYYITPNKTLALYAGHHRTYNDGKVISCTEFYPRFLKAHISKMADALIELYENKHFKDRCFRIRGFHKNLRISDYKKLLVEDDQYNDKVSSVKYQLPKGIIYRLYEHKNFEGEFMDLTGTGKLETISNLHIKKKGDVISSSQFIDTTS